MAITIPSMRALVLLVLVSLFLQLIVGKKLTEFPEIASLLNDEHINGITQSQFLHHEAARKQRKGLLGENNDNDKDPQLHLFCTSTASDESEPLHQKHSNLKALMGINIDVMTISPCYVKDDNDGMATTPFYLKENTDGWPPLHSM